MAILNEISAANNYSGNSVIGGAAPGAVTLDSKPLESLAHYTFFYNKNLYDEKQKEADLRAQELAELAKFNPDVALPQDKKAAIEAWNRIVTFGNDYARKPLTGQGKDELKSKWDFTEKIHSTLGLINKINKRAISYNAQKAQIEARTDITEGQKSSMLKDLDKLGATDTTVDIPILPAFNEKIPEIKKATLDSLEVSTNIGNEIVKTSMDIFLPLKVRGQSNIEVLGFNQLFVSPESAQYKNASEGQKRQYDFMAQSNNNFKFYKDLENYTAQAAHDERYQTNGKIDLNKIISSNAALAPIYKTLKDYKVWAADKREQAGRGVFVDHLNKSFKTINPVAADQFYDIDETKPLSADDMLMLHKWAESPKLVTKGEDIINTDDALQYAKLRQDDEQFKLGLGNKSNEDIVGAQSVLSEVADVIKTGKPIVKNYSNNVTDTVYEIADPNILKEFGSVDKDGKTTNVPDAFQYNPRTNNVELIYYKKDRKGDISKTASQKRIVDKEIALSPTQWFGQITKRKNPNKDIGSINNIIEKVYNAYGRNLRNLSDKYNTEKTPNQTQSTGSQQSNINIKGSQNQSGNDEDSGLNDFQYYQKYKRFRQKK